MLARRIDAQLQVMAGAKLMLQSKLVSWSDDPTAGMFSAVRHEDFEHATQASFDPVFGRLVGWILFSAGAEAFAKGVCLANRVEIRNLKHVPEYPPWDADVNEWSRRVSAHALSAGVRTVTNFGTIGDLTDKRKDRPLPHLVTLANRKRADPRTRDLVHAAYTLLGKTIRNRDAHGYVPNERNAHFDLVEAVSFARIWPSALRAAS